MQKIYEISRPGESVKITIPIRDPDVVAIIEENIAIAEGLKLQLNQNWNDILKLKRPPFHPAP